MPHYKDGTETKIGDVVRGKGYNCKDEFIGTVIGITPNSASCSIQVAYIATVEIPPIIRREQIHFVGEAYARRCVGCGAQGGEAGSSLVAGMAKLEYGQCDAFEKIL